MENVLVVGANGTTGKKIVHLLDESQYFKPVAMVRKSSQIKAFENAGIAVVLGDLEEEISHTVKHMDKVVFAAGSGGKKVKEVDENGAKKMVEASKKEGIKKFVMLSSMGADQPDQAEELKDYLKAKQHADEFLKTSNLTYTIVRPGSLTNEKPSGHIKLKTKLHEKGSISRADVAQTLVRSLHDDTVKNKTFEILEGDTLIGKALDNLESTNN